MTDQSMADQPMEDDEFSKLIFPVEQKQLEALALIAEQMRQAVLGLGLAVQELRRIAEIGAADREVTAVARDGSPMKAVSRVARG